MIAPLSHTIQRHQTGPNLKLVEAERIFKANGMTGYDTNHSTSEV
jgi:hypothetical protein